MTDSADRPLTDPIAPALPIRSSDDEPEPEPPPKTGTRKAHPPTEESEPEAPAD